MLKRSLFTFVGLLLIGACASFPKTSSVYDRYYTRLSTETSEMFHQRVMSEKCPLYSMTSRYDENFVPDPSDPEGVRGVIVGIQTVNGANPFHCQML